MTGKTGRLFLVDGYALIYRAFFAMLSRPLTTSRGENTSVPWGIVNFLLRLKERHRPDYVAWVHDAGSTDRHELLPDYKATREKLGEELQQDFDRSLERVIQLLRAFRIPLLTVDGYEADDVIATVAERVSGETCEVVVVSGDKDFYQLVGPHVSLLNPGRGGPAAVEEQFVNLANASERLGVPPERTTDFLALTGDSADNVPGVRGIGDKTAQKLVAEYGDLENILAHAAEIPGKRPREALLAEADRARLSKRLVTLRRDVPLEIDLEGYRSAEPDWNGVLQLIRELEFTTLARTLGARVEAASVQAPPPPVEGESAQLPVPADTTPAREYRIIESPAAIGALVSRAREAGRIGVAVLGSSPWPMRADLVGIAIATGEGEAVYLPLGHVTPGEMFADDARNLPPLSDPRMAPLAALLADAAVDKTGHDLKPALLLLRRAGVELAGATFDTMIASFLVEPGRRSHELDVVVLEMFGRQLPTRGTLSGSGRATRVISETDAKEAAAVAAAEADYALRLRTLMEPQLKQHQQEPLFRDVEMPLIAVLADMEAQGVAIDQELFSRLASEARRDLLALEKQIYLAAGTEFNLLSTPQLRMVLFEKLQLPVLKKTKTGASTDVEVLEELAEAGHEVPQLLMEYREVSKLMSTYLEALPRSVAPSSGRIHTFFNQIGASTGRLSSTEPNLQNIPVRTPRGAGIRRAFVPRPGHKLIVADYSQIELRLMAHLSGDEAFVAAFRAGGDIHRQTASVIFGVPLEDVSADQRARAKTINFATLYGQGPHALSRQLGISNAEAKQFIANYFERFAGVRKFLGDSIARAQERGYAETIFGRRRYIPELKDRNHNIRAFGERTATNSPIQGSAADLIKIAMVRIAGVLKQHQAHLILQVHDELIAEAPADRAEQVAQLIKHHMEGAAALTVPLVADIGIGDNWLDAKGG